MELEKLEKERSRFALELTPYVLKVAVALIAPLLIVFLMKYFFHLEKKQVLLILPFSFVLSLVLIYRMYLHLAKRVKKNKEAIEALREQNKEQDS